MSSNTEMLEKIDLYTRGKMAPEEKAAFERQLASDPQLKNQIELSMIVDQMVIGKEAWSLKEQMNKDLNKPKNNSGKYGIILALLVATSGTVYLISSDKSNHEKLAPAIQKEIKPSSKPVDVTTKEIPSCWHLPQQKNKITEQKSEKSAPNISHTTDSVQPTKTEESKVQIANSPVAVPKEESAKKDSSIAKKVNLCEGFRGDVESFVLPSCKGDETGEIHVNPRTVKGGTPPYIFLLEDRKSIANFDKLSAGSYQLTIVDANNCSVQSTGIVVPEKSCAQQQYSFNPEYDHSWNIPYDRDKKPVKFSILDKGGRVFYESQVKEFLPGEWKGESSSGMTLGAGLYLFSIDYTDGSTDHGTLLISR